jgi:hypothetical protein
MTDDATLIGADEVAFRLELTPPQLRILHAALRAYYDDFGHDEREVRDIVRSILRKLPERESLS